MFLLHGCAIETELAPSPEAVGTDPTGPELVATEIEGVEDRDCLGELSYAGDLDADGNDDLLVGLPHSDLGGGDAGAILGLRGPLDATDDAMASPQFRVVGERGYLGERLIVPADLDGDANLDLLFSDDGDIYGIPGPLVGEYVVPEIPTIARADESSLAFATTGQVAEGAGVDLVVRLPLTNEIAVFSDLTGAARAASRSGCDDPRRSDRPNAGSRGFHRRRGRRYFDRRGLRLAGAGPDRSGCSVPRCRGRPAPR